MPAAARQSNNIALQERLAAEKASLTRELNTTNNALKKEMQSIEINAAELAREDNQAFQLELQEKKESLQVLLQATEFTNDKELIEARTKAQKELTKLQTIEDLKKFETQFELLPPLNLRKWKQDLSLIKSFWITRLILKCWRKIERRHLQRLKMLLIVWRKVKTLSLALN